MPVTRKSVGSGLTRYTVHSVSPEEWFRTAGEEPQFLAGALPTYPERLLQWREWATRVLARAGRPTTNKFVEVASNGNWRPVKTPLEYPCGNTRIIPGLSYSDAEEESSLEWYAAKVLRLVNPELDLLKSRKKRGAGKALKTTERRVAELSSRAIACELGATIERIRWKFRHEAPALAGYRQRDHIKALQESGAQANRLKGAQREKEIEPLFRAAIRRSSRRVSELKTSDIINLMKKVDPDAVKATDPTTLGRYVKRLRSRWAHKKDSTST